MAWSHQPSWNNPLQMLPPQIDGCRVKWQGHVLICFDVFCCISARKNHITYCPHPHIQSLQRKQNCRSLVYPPSWSPSEPSLPGEWLVEGAWKPQCSHCSQVTKKVFFDMSIGSEKAESSEIILLSLASVPKWLYPVAHIILGLETSYSNLFMFIQTKNTRTTWDHFASQTGSLRVAPAFQQSQRARVFR